MQAVCPDQTQLQSFLLGDVSDEHVDALNVHLQSCETCQTELATMESTEDSFVEQLKQASLAEEDPYSVETECRWATARALAALAIAESNASIPEDFPKTIGEYDIVRPLGRGGMGQIFLGQHTKLGREVAIKFIAHHRRWDNSMRDRFATEMRMIGQLNHPNIVQAHDAREVDGVAVLVTEFIDGLDAAAILRRVGSVGVADACAIASEVCQALSYIDAQSLVHRDIKPSNIMIDQQGQVKLLDLGLARIRNDETEIGNFTATGQAVGTADYVAPEQINDGRNVDIRADIYGLGCALYKLLSGQVPFADENYSTAFAKMTAHVSERPASLQEFCKDVPAALSELVDEMLAKSPSERPQTAAEVNERLLPFVEHADLKGLVQQASGLSEQRRPAREALLDQPSVQPRTKSSGQRRFPFFVALAAGLMGVLLGVWLGVTITIKKPDGTITRVEIPDGSTAIIDAEGNLEVLLGDGQKLQLPSSQVQIQAPAQAMQLEPAFPELDVSYQPGFAINADHPLYDRIEPGDRLDVFAVPRSINEGEGAHRDFAHYNEQLIASNKLTSHVVDHPQRPDTKAFAIELSGNEVQKIGQLEKTGFEIDFRAYDPRHQLVHDRTRMKGVWRMVYARMLGQDMTADVKDHVALITERDCVFFREDGNDRVDLKFEKGIEGDNIMLTMRKTIRQGDGKLDVRVEVLYRFLENGRLEIAFNDISLDPDAKLPLTFKDAQIFMRLERVEAPQTVNQRRAFAALASLETAPIKLEMYIARPHGATIPDSFRRAKVESTGESIWHGSTPLVTNKDIISADVSEDETAYRSLQIEMSDAAARRVQLATQKNRGNYLAVYLDGKLVCAPEIVDTIAQNAAITGKFEKEELEAWAAGIVPQLKLPFEETNLNRESDH